MGSECRSDICSDRLMSSRGQSNVGLRYKGGCGINLLFSRRNLRSMVRTFISASLERASHNDWGVFEYRYSFHLGREDVVSLCAIFFCLNTNAVVPESEGYFTQGTDEFISEEVGFDGVIVDVKNGHNASVVAVLSASPVGFIFLSNIICQGFFISRSVYYPT